MKKKIVIIGAGFSSLSAACYLAKAGYRVQMLEKNNSVGGRARQRLKSGFKFDIGPTWYWMPDIFERFFSDFDQTPSSYYTLDRLDPAYQVYFGRDDSIKIPGNTTDIYKVFEEEELGSSKALKKFLSSAAFNYRVAVNDLIYKPGLSFLELVNKHTISRLWQFFTSIRQSVNRLFSSRRLRKIVEFPVLFLGAKPSRTPAFYNFMNYADFGLGTWHPKGGMSEVVNAFVKLATSLGVDIKTDQDVRKIVVEKGFVKGVFVADHFIAADIVISGADYQFTESILEKAYRTYAKSYWESRTFAPSALLFFVAFDTNIQNVSHHTLFFDTDFDEHASAIYDQPKWPKEPLFYASFPSITDGSFAPVSKESATFLIPLAPGVKDTPEKREAYFLKIIQRLEHLTGQQLAKQVLFKESYCVSDFIKDYNAFKGNAYGLANTLMQTAFLRPGIKSKKVKNLYFTGQLTVPGPGVPPAIISGKIVADQIINQR